MNLLWHIVILLLLFYFLGASQVICSLCNKEQDVSYGDTVFQVLLVLAGHHIKNIFLC